MAGWDEGPVFFSDQQTLDMEDQHGLSKHVAQRKYVEFIKNFHAQDEEDETATAKYFYRDQLQQLRNKLTVDLKDIRCFDPELGEQLVKNPAEYLPLLETAAADVVSGLQNKTEDGEEPPPSDVQVFVHSKEFFGPKSIRELTSEHVSSLVMVRGIVIAAAKTKAKATNITVMCKNCRNTRTIPCKPGFGGAAMPRTCDMQQIGDEKCPLDPFVVLPEKSQYVDQQTLKLQENPEDVPTGELPRNLQLLVDRNLVQQIVPGTRVKVVGIFSIYQPQMSRKEQAKAAVAIRQPYIRVVGLEQDNDGNMRGLSQFSSAEERDFKEFASRPDVYDAISRHIAPSIFGHEDVKRATACLLFGGSRKGLPDGTRLRGDVNVLLLGDPSTAKSQFLKFVEKAAPIAFYTSGKGSSAAGLTASVTKDPGSGEFTLEGGAMVLADGGVVCIDEFDKMRPEDRVAIHEAMEQQTISIAKAGITTMLNSRTAVLAAANPPSGRYDDLKTAQENIELQSTILSRFDLIFIVRDERSWERDVQIARHVVGVHRQAGEDAAVQQSAEKRAEESWLKRYVEYCRSSCAPRLSDGAARLLQGEYVRIRQDARDQANGEAPAVPITVRQLEAIVRLAESLAKMGLQQQATESHVREALRLFKQSTLEAAKSGITDGLVISAEQRGEVQNIEMQVRRRLGIGMSKSTRGLVDEVMAVGFSEPMVWRTLIYMDQQKDLEFRRERRQVYRLQ